MYHLCDKMSYVVFIMGYKSKNINSYIRYTIGLLNHYETNPYFLNEQTNQNKMHKVTTSFSECMYVAQEINKEKKGKHVNLPFPLQIIVTEKNLKQKATKLQFSLGKNT